MDLKVKIYSTPGCRACASLKNAMKNSEYKDYVEAVDITKDDSAMEFLSSKNIMSVPTVAVFYNGENNVIVGARPVETIDNFIKEFINY